MVLTLDIGNQVIMLGGFEKDELRFVARLHADPNKTEDEYAASLLTLLSLHGVEKAAITGAIVASVVPPLNQVIKKAITLLFHKEPLLVGPGIKSGIGIRCDTPSSVGADLIAASVAAHYLYQSPALIIDVDTVTKMTLVDEKGSFIGTSIMPGIMMGLDALSEKTAQLPKISLELPPTVICKNTQDCMRSGVLYGHASLIDGMIDRIEAEYPTPLTVLITGSAASFVTSLCKHAMQLDEHLVLKGLNVLYQKNRPDTH